MVYETYSERQRRLAKASGPDVYTYDTIPEKLRNQVMYVWDDALGDGQSDRSRRHYEDMEKIILRSEGLRSLAAGQGTRFDPRDVCRHWISSCTTDQALDIIELSAQIMLRVDQQGAIDEINHRFRQGSIGFQFEGGQLIKIDDQFVHAEVVKPAIGLLTSDSAYQAASKEFMTAHQHYREGSHQDAVVAANRAFESTLKAICAKRKWPVTKGARASDLIKIVRNNGLFPSYLDNAFDSYIAMMKSGLPEVRNNAGGHGPAPGDAEVPAYVAAYAIHLSAATIVVAIEAEKHSR